MKKLLPTLLMPFAALAAPCDRTQMWTDISAPDKTIIARIILEFDHAKGEACVKKAEGAGAVTLAKPCVELGSGEALNLILSYRGATGALSYPDQQLIDFAVRSEAACKQQPSKNTL